MKLLIVYLILFFTNVGFSEVTEPSATPILSTAPAQKGNELSSTTYVMCKNKSEVRTLHIEKKKEYCVTTYSKEGIETVVGKSSSPKLCHSVFQKIQDNLEKASWKCKDITQSRVSSSVD